MYGSFHSNKYGKFIYYVCMYNVNTINVCTMYTLSEII